MVSLLLVAPDAMAQSTKRIKSPKKSGAAAATAAEVSGWPSTSCRRGDAVRANGHLVWCGKKRISEVVWSKSRHAVAFASRSRGRVSLHVAFVGGMGTGTVLTWPAAIELRRGQRPEVTWLGHNRVGMGRTIVRPQLVASWKLRQM
jgi:hypothetical protein